MALELTIKERLPSILHASFDITDHKRGLRLHLWNPLLHALRAYEDIYEQGAALGHSSAGGPPDPAADAPADQPVPALPLLERLAATADAPSDQPESAIFSESSERQAAQPLGFPFPCQSESEASHLARLSNIVAPARQASADGAILTSTHSLGELAALITFARYCEPTGLLQRSERQP
jgi:hypothetical protein